MSPTATQEQREKLIGLIDEVATAMLVTHADESAMHARPMVIADHQEEEIFFLSEAATGKLQQILDDSAVNVCVQNGNVFLSLAGDAETLDDAAARVEEMWQESWKAWFPEGPTDPGLRLIRFRPRSAEYWDFDGMNGLRFALEWSRALLRGEKLEYEDPDAHDRMEL